MLYQWTSYENTITVSINFLEHGNNDDTRILTL